MTVSSEVTKNVHLCSGAAVAFDYEFKIASASELRVILTDPDGSDVLLSGASYSVTGVGQNTGGQVICNTVYATGYTLTIYHEPSYLNGTSFSDQGRFKAETHEAAFDNLHMICIAIKGILERCIKVSVTSPKSPDELLGDLLGAVDTALDAAASAGSSALSAGVAKDDAEAAAASILTNAGFIAVSADILGVNGIGAVADALDDIDVVLSDVLPNMTAVLSAPTHAQAAIDAATAAQDAADHAESVVNGEGAPLSVIGRASDTAGARADIVASADNTFLKCVDGVLLFGVITGSDIPNGSIITEKLGEGSVTPSKINSGIQALGNVSGAVVINLALGRTITMTATANVTLSFTNGKAAGHADVAHILITFSGNRTVGFSGVAVKTPAGETYVTTANGIDELLVSSSDGWANAILRFNKDVK